MKVAVASFFATCYPNNLLFVISTETRSAEWRNPGATATDRMENMCILFDFRAAPEMTGRKDRPECLSLVEMTSVSKSTAAAHEEWQGKKIGPAVQRRVGRHICAWE